MNIIECPKCQAEYMPCEIFLPDSFFNVRKNRVIVRDENKKLLHRNLDMNLKEDFECEYCGTRFRVQASVKFSTEEIPQIDFTQDYVTKLRKNDIFMIED